MRRLLVATVLASLILPAGHVTARVLSLRTAATKARAEAYIIAGSLKVRPAISVRHCTRVSRLIVDCAVRFRTLEACAVQTIRVRSVPRGLNTSFIGAPRRCP